MNIFLKFLGLAFLLVLIDLPWLYIQGPAITDLIQDIQGDRAMNVRLWGALPVYLALSYLVSECQSAPRAFLTGMATYAVYDFTQIVSFDKYPLWLALADSAWGGVLVSLVWWSGVQLGLITPQR